MIDEVDVGVVGEEGAVVCSVGRVEGKEHQGRVQRLLHDDAGGVDLSGELWSSLIDAELCQDLVDVGVGTNVEGDVHAQSAIAGAGASSHRSRLAGTGGGPRRAAYPGGELGLSVLA